MVLVTKDVWFRKTINPIKSMCMRNLLLIRFIANLTFFYKYAYREFIGTKSVSFRKLTE